MARALADDRFRRLEEITVHDHALPEDLLPGARTAVVWFVPFKHHIQKDNIGGERPTAGAMKALIEENGGRAALTPPPPKFDKERVVSLWSHKHTGHLTGLGRYGTNCHLITPEGCGGRMGSLVADLELGYHPLVTADMLCLLKAGKRCVKCIQTCLIQILSEDGVDRPCCYARFKENCHLLMEPDGLPETTDVRAKCQAGMPCGVKSPLPVGQRSTSLPTGFGRSSIHGSSGGGCRLIPFFAEGRLDGPSHFRQRIRFPDEAAGPQAPGLPDVVGLRVPAGDNGPDARSDLQGGLVG